MDFTATHNHHYTICMWQWLLSMVASQCNWLNVPHTCNRVNVHHATVWICVIPHYIQ